MISSITKAGIKNIKKTKKLREKNKRMFHIRLFLPDEDALLMSTEVKSNMDILDLAKQLNRTPITIKNRIKKLEVNFKIPGISLMRHPDSIYNRWGKKLRVWLLGYYSIQQDPQLTRST